VCHVCMFVRMCIYMYVRANIFIYVCTYVCIFVCMYVSRMYVCAYVMCVHKHIMDKMKNLLLQKMETL
jgi:hypothetical protein